MKTLTKTCLFNIIWNVDDFFDGLFFYDLTTFIILYKRTYLIYWFIYFINQQ